MEDRALGFAAAPHAQLADAPAGPRLRRRGPRRVHGRPRAGRVPRALRRSRRRARANADDRHARCRATATAYLVETDAGSWEAEAVVIASGAFNLPQVPAVSATLPAALDQVTPLDYKRPDQLRRRSGARRRRLGHRPAARRRAAALRARGDRSPWASTSACRGPTGTATSCGGSTQIGRLDERYDEVDDLVRARHVPSPQLVGTPDRADLDLNALTARGASLVGRLGAVERRHRLLLRLAAQRLQPRRPQAQAPAQHDRPVGRPRRRARVPSRRGSTITRGS